MLVVDPIMSKLIVFWLLVLHYSISINYYRYGCVVGKSISRKPNNGLASEDIDEQLKILNKPPVKTFETNEVIFDCIDINKQPAFDHPLLKDHKIQLKPSSYPKGWFKTSSQSSKLQHMRLNANLTTYACPKGTVPIRRTSKKDLIKAKSFSKSFLSSTFDSFSNAPPKEPYVEPYIQYVAWRHSLNATSLRKPPLMHGLQAEIKVDNPTTQENQISASILLAEGGPADNFSTIWAGWMVAPTLYGDNHTHLTIFWRDGPKNGCFNMECPGFVQTSSEIPIGDVITPVSEYGGQGYKFVGGIYQDVKTLHWYFTVNVGNKSQNIGYWPREIIPYLISTANYIAWGGLVRTPPNTPGPQMGNGHFPEGDDNKVSSMRNILYVNESYTLEIPGDDRFWQNRVDNDDCYDIDYLENLDVGKTIYFGGPGENC